MRNPEYLRPRRTHRSTDVLALPGGTEDNDLWFYAARDTDENVVMCSTWVPSKEQRERIAAGENLELVVWGTRHPPVSLLLDKTPLGKKPVPVAGESE